MVSPLTYTYKKHGLDVLHIKWHKIKCKNQSQRLGDNGDLGN